MFQRFEAQGFQKNFAQGFIAAAIPQHGAQIQFAMVSQARTDFPVRSQTHFVALVSKMQVGQRADEADERAGMLELVI